MDFFFGCFFGGSLNDACNFDAYFCFFGASRGGEPGDCGEVGVDGCLGDNGAKECSGAGRGDGGGGGELGDGCGDAGLDA